MSKQRFNPLDNPESGGTERDRRTRLANITYAIDDHSFKGRLRRQIRNPSLRSALIVVFLVIAIPVALAYPSASRTARENWADVQQSRERHFVNVTAASWIYPFLRRQAERMQTADVPNEWRSISFTNGPCLPDHMDQLLVGKYGYAVRVACESLDSIQLAYIDDCADTATCNIPQQAVDELQDVLDRLKVAFSDANLVQPYTDDQGQVQN